MNNNIPDFQSIMLPLLNYCKDIKAHTTRETIEYLAQYFKLSDNERQQLLPSGTQSIFDNRVGWAKAHLTKAGLLESLRRSVFHITERGLMALSTNPKVINMAFLKQYDDYLEFIGNKKEPLPSKETKVNIIGRAMTPEELLADNYLEVRNLLADDLLDKVKQSPPAFFERIVIELLVKMGYGGTIKDAGETTRLTNDGGIDGIIKQDILGLDIVYIQAKRWEKNSVGRPEVQSFAGALDGQRASKGIFITTSNFTQSAIDYVASISKKIILIDGPSLANYMIDYNLGVSIVHTYEVKRIDYDYFEE